MEIIFNQLSLFFMFLLCGLLLGKSKVVNHEHTKILSALEIYLFLPCTVFTAFYNNFNMSNLTQYYKLIIISVVILIILICFSHLISGFLSNNTYDKKIYKYSLTISNYGYMGYALAQGLFGAEGLLHMVLFAIPFSFYTYTFGYCMLMNKKISLKRLINPVIISIVLGALFGIFYIRLPDVLETFTSKSANCMAPISMLLVGITLSEFDIKHLLFDKKIYIVSIIRLILIPSVIMFVLKHHFDDTLVRIAVLLCAMPCGLNTIVFPKLVGEDCQTGAKLAFVSNILAIISVPVILNFI